MEECPEVVAKLEPIVLQLVALILENSIVEFYEEALSLIYNMTANRITSDMWQCFELLQKVLHDKVLAISLEHVGIIIVGIR